MQALLPAMADLRITPLDRFATGDHVVDDMLVHMHFVGPCMDNAPLSISWLLALRLVHH